MEKAMIAMSGGVDSSVAAYLSLKMGLQCIGATMRLFTNDVLGDSQQSSCCSLDDTEDARSVAYRLGMRFYVFNFSQDFREMVMDDFVSCYEQGLTPNPCIRCNRYLKFQKLLERATILGCDTVVTGHYARIMQDKSSGRYLMYKALDKSKDQSYVLYSLTQYQLSHLLLPLGELTKEQVRSIAEGQGFVNAHKKDSQDICFVPDGDYVSFMERYTGKAYPGGDYLDLAGKVVGHHQGAVRYTIGQRKGLNLAMGRPVYVCGKDMQANTVTVGDDSDLYKTTLIAGDGNFLPFDELTEPMEVLAKARYRMTEQPATISPLPDGKIQVVFHQSQRALTPGQAVVFYDGDMVVGGATIERVL